MEQHSRGSTTHKNERSFKQRSRKIVTRLTYNPLKHKQRFTKNLRQKLASKTIIPEKVHVPGTSLKIGSININGLDFEASWAVEQLIGKHNFDVSFSFIIISPKN